MKPGRRALGIAESYRGRDADPKSTLAGAVVRADRVVDDFVLSTCSVGGLDATDAVIGAWNRLDRPDIRYLFVAGIAPAWYNLIDVAAIADAIDRPVFSISFEESDGLETGIADAFKGVGRDRRLRRYRELPERRRIDIGDESLFVRSVGVDPETAATVVDAYTYDRRPEPLRVAKRLARRVDTARRDGAITFE